MSPSKIFSFQQIVDPHQGMLKHHIKSSGTEETIEAQMDGKYTYCFHNVLNYPPSKLISFYTFKDDLEHVKREKGMFKPHCLMEIMGTTNRWFTLISWHDS